MTPAQRELMDIKAILDLHFPQVDGGETTAQTVGRLLLEYKGLRALLAELPIVNNIIPFSGERRDSKQVLLEFNDKFEQIMTELGTACKRHRVGK